MMAKTCPQLYRPYIIDENGQTVLYLEVLKAIYGCLQSAILFYKKLRKDLESQGFVVNPYNPCVANKIIDGHQCTITWHVDDLKASHKHLKVLCQLVEWSKLQYENENIGKLKANEGKVHVYLGMTLDYSTKGEVKVYMKEYVQEIIDAFLPVS